MRVVLSIFALVLMIPMVAQQNGQRALVPVQVGEKWGYADNSGRIAIAPSFDEAERFSEGLAAVGVRSGPKPGDQLIDKLLAPPNERLFKWGFIDESGQIAVAPQYANSGSFSEGLARVKVGEDFTGKWGYINSKGEMLIEPQFYYSEDFKNGRAAVWIGKAKVVWGRKHVTVIESKFRVSTDSLTRLGSSLKHRNKSSSNNQGTD